MKCNRGHNHYNSLELANCNKLGSLPESIMPTVVTPYAQSYKRLSVLIKGITFGYPLKEWNARVAILTGFTRQDSFHLAFSVTTPHRDTGVPVRLECRETWHLDKVQMLSDTVIIRLIRNQFLTLMHHELDESFMFNGERIFDPHNLNSSV